MPKKSRHKNRYGEGSVYWDKAKRKWVGQMNIGKDFNGKLVRNLGLTLNS